MAREDNAIAATAVPAGLVQRVAAGVRYAVSGVLPNDWFGPAQPMAPQAPASVSGRSFDYPVGYNVLASPRAAEPIGFAELRGLAESYDLLRLIIETRKDQIEKLDWTVQYRKNMSVASGSDRPRQIEKFLQRPDGEHGWTQWLRLLLEDLLVIDAPSLYLRRTAGGDPYALEVIDGATIKRVLDERGRTPIYPNVAYQQVLKGLPAVDYDVSELLYVPRNPRPHKIYGFSPVEQIVMTVNIALRRQVSLLSYYTEGNTPEALIGVPDDWTPDQIGQFQAYWDSLLEGNLGSRRHTKFVPGGLKYQPLREPALKDEFDEWLARVVCFAFSLSPTAFVRQNNRATAETQQETALTEGLVPLQRWVKELMDRLLAEFFNAPELEFAWLQTPSLDPLIQAQVNQIYLASGVKTVAEVRAELGLDKNASGETAKLQKFNFNAGQPCDKNNQKWEAQGSGGDSEKGPDGSRNADGSVNLTIHPNPPPVLDPTGNDTSSDDAAILSDSAASQASQDDTVVDDGLMPGVELISSRQGSGRNNQPVDLPKGFRQPPDKATRNRAEAIYGETAGLTPQLIDPNGSLRNEANWDPTSAAELELARTYIGIVSERNPKVYFATPFNPKSPIESKAWNNAVEIAIKSANGSQLDPKIDNFFLKQKEPGKEKKAPWDGKSKLYYSFGPFNNFAGGGDVPKGAHTYIEFSGKKQTN